LQCTLLVYVYDATRRLMPLHFTATESTFSYVEATRPHLASRGKPVAFCSDKYSVFRKTGANKDGKGVTHIGRALSQSAVSWQSQRRASCNFHRRYSAAIAISLRRSTFPHVVRGIFSTKNRNSGIL
jgi:hypothetical protein